MHKMFIQGHAVWEIFEAMTNLIGFFVLLPYLDNTLPCGKLLSSHFFVMYTISLFIFCLTDKHVPGRYSYHSYDCILLFAKLQKTTNQKQMLP